MRTQRNIHILYHFVLGRFYVTRQSQKPILWYLTQHIIIPLALQSVYLWLLLKGQDCQWLEWCYLCLFLKLYDWYQWLSAVRQQWSYCSLALSYWYHGDSTRVSWRLKSMAFWLPVQKLVKTHDKKTSVPHDWPILIGETTPLSVVIQAQIITMTS